MLNRLYLPADAEDEADYRRELRELGVKSGYAAYGSGIPQLRERIEESWQRVFELPDMTAPSVCAHIWELNAAEIVRIVRPGESLFDK